MYNKNVPEVPTLNSDKIINLINRKVIELDEDERIEISEIISYHECEPSVVAEKVSELLNVSYESIFDLL